MPLSAAGGSLSAWFGLPRSAPLAGPTVSGDYEGNVTLQGVYAGEYNITSIVPISKDLGNIDLSLHLEQNGNVASGFVMLDYTPVFTKEDTITATPIGPTPGPQTPTPAPQPLDIGPKVHGTFDGTTLSLESDPFSMSMNGRTVTRRFRLK